MSTKRKHVTLSLREKKEIINKLDEGETTANLARTYGVGTSTIYGIKVNRDKILEFLWTAEGGLKERKTLKPGYYREMENALFSWYMQERARHAPLSGDILREKAKQIYDKISKKDDFRASDGWLMNFKKRFRICFSTATGEKISSDASAVDHFHRKLELKIQMDEMAQMLKEETLAALNKSMAAAPQPPLSIDANTPDVLIGQSVELCLKNIKDMRLKLKYRKKFRALIQECEEAAEDQQNVEEAEKVSSKMVDKSIQIHLTKPFGSETEMKLVNQMASPNNCVNNPSRLSKEVSSEPQEVIREDKSLPTVPEIESIFAKCIASQMKHLPQSVCNLLRREIKVLVESKRNSNSFSADPQETSCDKDKFVKNEMDIEEFVIQD